MKRKEFKEAAEIFAEIGDLLIEGIKGEHPDSPLRKSYIAGVQQYQQVIYSLAAGQSLARAQDQEATA